MAHVTLALLLDVIRIIKDKGDKAIEAAVEAAALIAYRNGYGAALKDLQVSPTTEEEAEGDGMPVHDITNPIVRDFLKLLPVGGYAQNDLSRTWYYYKYVRDSHSKNMADRGNPYLVFITGDSLTLECEGEPTQTILPGYKVFECYNLLPKKTYHWSVTKDGKIVKEGYFKTIGDVRMINTKTWPNVRDIGYGNILKFNKVLSGANPDNVEVGSDEYNFIKSLNIDFQLNLRTPKADSVMDQSWRADIFPDGKNINISAYSQALTNVTGWKSAITTLIAELDKGHRVAFNCFAGADRTGTFRYILQGICCVPKHIAQGFWEMTSFLYWENFKRWDIEESSGGELRTFDKKLEALYGKDFYTQCYKFLTKKVGVTDAQIKKLQGHLMVDPSSAPNI